MTTDAAPASQSSIRFRGFPWWLPLCTAAVALLAALAVLGSAEAEWEAGVRIWLRDDAQPAEAYADLVRDRSTLETAAQIAGIPWPAERFDEALDIEIDGATLIVAIRAPSEWQARALAANIADHAVNEAQFNFRTVDAMQVLGPIDGGARQVSPRTPELAGLAAGAGLLGGLALAAALAGRRRERASTVARTGRHGLRPVAVLTDEHAYAGAPESAIRLADEIERSARDGPSAEDGAEAQRPGTITLFIGVGAADPAPAAAQAVRALAGRGHHAAWIDLRPPAPTVRRLPGLPRRPERDAPKPRLGLRRAPPAPPEPSAQPPAPAPQIRLAAADPAALGSPPPWLAGAPLPATTRAGRAADLLRANAARFAHVIAVAAPHDLPDPLPARAILAADAADPAFDQNLANAAARVRAQGFPAAGAALNATHLEAEELGEVSQPPD